MRKSSLNDALSRDERVPDRHRDEVEQQSFLECCSGRANVDGEAESELSLENLGEGSKVEI